MFKMKKIDLGLNRLQKGFTLIELLVVIAIIGILSSVVLASLNTARGKGNDAKVKAQLAGLRAAAEIYYDTTGSYGIATDSCAAGMFADTISGMASYTNTAGAFPSGATPVCRALTTSGGSYSVSALLPGLGGTNAWCVDSSGKSVLLTGGTLGAGDTSC